MVLQNGVTVGLRLSSHDEGGDHVEFLPTKERFFSMLVNVHMVLYCLFLIMKKTNMHLTWKIIFKRSYCKDHFHNKIHTTNILFKTNQNLCLTFKKFIKANKILNGVWCGGATMSSVTSYELRRGLDVL